MAGPKQAVQTCLGPRTVTPSNDVLNLSRTPNSTAAWKRRLCPSLLGLVTTLPLMTTHSGPLIVSPEE